MGASDAVAGSARSLERLPPAFTCLPANPRGQPELVGVTQDRHQSLIAYLNVHKCLHDGTSGHHKTCILTFSKISSFVMLSYVHNVICAPSVGHQRSKLSIRVCKGQKESPQKAVERKVPSVAS